MSERSLIYYAIICRIVNVFGNIFGLDDVKLHNYTE